MASPSTLPRVNYHKIDSNYCKIPFDDISCCKVLPRPTTIYCPSSNQRTTNNNNLDSRSRPRVHRKPNNLIKPNNN